MYVAELPKRPKVTSHTLGGRDGERRGKLTIENLTASEVDAIQGMLNGANWVGAADDGGLEALPRIARVPDPIIEPFFGGAWQHSKECGGAKSYRETKVQGDPKRLWSHAYYISHLCGYHYTKEAAIEMGRRLQGWGFECLRSRRNLDGKYWEVWYLPGIWCAEGGLLEFAESIKATRDMSPDEDHEETVRKIVGWICRHASFGSIDVTTQRAAMVAD